MRVVSVIGVDVVVLLLFVTVVLVDTVIVLLL